jgi:hypothetical protein
MLNPLQPSDIYPSFTWERLSTLAALMFTTRKWVAEQAAPERGDGLCSIGFRAWEQTKFAVTKAAAVEHKEWLSVSEVGAHFTFKLRLMPIRFLRGDSEKPLPANYALPSESERAAIAHALDESGQPKIVGVFRLLIQADNTGSPLGVYLVLANEAGETMLTWKIPTKVESNAATPIVVPQTPVILPGLELQSVEEAMAAERAKVLRDAEAARTHDKEKGA